MRTVTVGTRGSTLALAQTRWVIARLKEEWPETEFRLQTISTKGDRNRESLEQLAQKGDKGFWVKEIPADLHHRATGNDLRGRLHRAAQLRDVLRALDAARTDFQERGLAALPEDATAPRKKRPAGEAAAADASAYDLSAYRHAPAALAA